MKKVFITGGAGFIGSRVAHRFVETGHGVVIFDTFKQYLLPDPDAEQFTLMARLRDIIKDMEVVRGDALNKDYLRRTLNRVKPDIIVHMASLPLASLAIEHSEEAFESILDSTVNIMEVMRDFDHDCRLVYISSSMVYGDFQEEWVTEESQRDPKDVYGSLKLAGEIIARGYMKRYGLDLAIVRPTAVYGPHDANQRVLYKFVTTALNGGVLRVDGDGSAALDFTFVDDTAQGIFLAATHSDGKGRTFNIARGEAQSLRRAIEIIQTHIGEVHVEFAPMPDYVPIRGTLDVSHARRVLGYSPKYDLETGLGVYIEHLRENPF